MSTLEAEMNTYKTLLPSLLAEQGRYALIFNGKLLGTFVSYEDALKIGYEKCGVTSFLVKKISADEHIAYFSRDIDLSCLA
jgi:hypothetical protein